MQLISFVSAENSSLREDEKDLYLDDLVVTSKHGTTNVCCSSDNWHQPIFIYEMQQHHTMIYTNKIKSLFAGNTGWYQNKLLLIW